MQRIYTIITILVKRSGLPVILCLAYFWTATAQADPVRFTITYTNLVASDTACFGLAIDPVTGLADAPKTVVTTFDFDSSAIPSGNLGGMITIDDISDASLKFGEGEWSLLQLKSFVLDINAGGSTFNSLGYEFDAIETETTKNGTSIDTAFQLTIQGVDKGSDIGCIYQYIDSIQVITDVPDIEPEEKPSAHTGIAPLAAQVKLLGEQGRLNRGDVKSLRNQLALAHFQLASANTRGALHHLEVFTNKILKAADKQKLLPEETKLFTDSVGTLQQLIVDLQESLFTVAVPENCPLSTPCSPTTFFVSVGANVPRTQMDGSPENPFDSLALALVNAESQSLQCVELRVSVGTYTEGVIPITRDTAILGEPGVLVAASLQNYGGHSLSIENLVFVNSGLRGAAVAAIEVDGACASTSINNVNFIDVDGHAVLQNGGRLEMNSSLVTLTRTQENDSSSGVGVWLSGGVDACLSDITLNNNLGGALVAEGPDTRVFASRFIASSNIVNPLVLARAGGGGGATGAVEVRDNALLLGEVVKLNFNEVVFALLVHDNARAHLRNASVTSTFSVPDNPLDIHGGINVAVRNDAAMELTSFTLRNAALSGVLVSNSLIRLTNGYVYDNMIGVNYIPESSPLECLESNVLFFDNGVNLDSSQLPVPGTGSDFLSGSPTTPPEEEGALPDGCALVKFVHPWCNEADSP